ncbi:MAG: hypothetical protein ACLQPH_07095 [Acidimicrobiales bacterium]
MEESTACQSGASQPTLGQIKLRILDGRARIRRIVARAASVDVWVDGRSAGIDGIGLEAS